MSFFRKKKPNYLDEIEKTCIFAIVMRVCENLNSIS